MATISQEIKMQESIKAVLQLSKEDRLVRVNHKLLKTFPEKKKRLLFPLNRVEHQISEYKKRIGEFAQQIEERERLIAIEKEKIVKSDAKLLSVRNQKEYTASQKEIETAKKTIRQVEDQILEFESKREPIEEKLTVISEEYKEEKSSCDSVMRKIEEEEAIVKKKIENYNQLKEHLVAKIEPELLRKYEILSKRNIIPSAIEISESRCMGCAMSIPAQLFNEIIHYSRGVCPHCGRLLFYKKQEFEEEPSPKKKTKSRKPKAKKTAKRKDTARKTTAKGATTEKTEK